LIFSILEHRQPHLLQAFQVLPLRIAALKAFQSSYPVSVMPYAWICCLTLIVAVWTDVCDVCEHGLVTRTTTITTLHCECTLTPVPTVPMTTSVKACSICGGDGSR